MDDPTKELLAVPAEARDLLARPDNDFSWSSWYDAADALGELDGLIRRLQEGEQPDRAAIQRLFAPTKRMQEVSIDSGWGTELVELADRAVGTVARRNSRRLVIRVGF